MSRANYSSSCENWSLICWRGAVTSAIRGKRGQAILHELLDALDAMPEKKLIANDLEAEGQYCTLGVLGEKRGIDMSKIDPEDSELVAKEFGIADALAREIVYENDEGCWRTETPEQRWTRMRAWVAKQLRDLIQPTAELGRTA